MSAVSRMAPTTTTAMTMTAIPSMRPMRSTSRCSGVRSSSVRPSSRATLPISVAMPVAVTTARPRPRVTAVPLNTMFDPVAQARRLGERARRPSATASLSPVSDASATMSEAASTRRASALTASPSASSRTSPGTTSAAGDALLAPVAHDARRGRRHALQRGDRLLGARLLHVAEHGVERRRSTRMTMTSNGTSSRPSRIQATNDTTTAPSRR